MADRKLEEIIIDRLTERIAELTLEVAKLKRQLAELPDDAR